jgi:O-succinylbenzoate synthase
VTSAPSLAELQACAVPFAVPLRVPFRGVRERSGLLLPGPAGWGEFAPFDDYPPPRAARWLAAAVEAAWDGWPAPARGSVAVNAIVPAVPAGEVAALLVEAAAAPPGGSVTVKVKVTGDLGADRDRVAAVRAAAGPGARIRLDVNAGWTLAQARRELPLLEHAAAGLEYVEQPLTSLTEMALLRRATGVPLAVDEALRGADDPFDPALHEAVRQAADVAVLKVAPLGGVRPVLALAAALAMPTVISGAMDTAVGLSAGVAAACALPVPPLACGLGTGRLLAADVTAEPLVPRGGRLAPVPAVPDPAALAAARSRVSGAQERALRERLEQAWRAGRGRAG